jgi:hypothetical protein
MTDTWDRINAANAAAGVFEEWSVAERDQIEALAVELNLELEQYQVIHCYRTKDGTQLTFWCQFCKRHHLHGRHMRDDYLRYASQLLSGQRAESDPERSSLAVFLEFPFRAYLRKVASCAYGNGSGVCTCPTGIGDGHRIEHCHNPKSPYNAHGYILHEVEPNDIRALTKPPRKPRQKPDTN